jgi:DNA-binding CsgD family transcriptional regulator
MERLLDSVAELQVPVPLSGFGERLVRLVAQILPNTTIAFDQINEEDGSYLLDHNCQLTLGELENLFSRLKELYRQNPIYDYMQKGGTGPVIDLADLTSASRFQMTDFYQDVFRPVGLKHQVSVIIPRAGWVSTMTINHDRSIPRRIQTLMSLAARHIASAHQTVCLLERLDFFPEEVDTSSVIFTPRENEVAGWLAKGKRNSEISIILGCSPRTVDKHVENILRKTGAETRAEAARNFRFSQNF